MEPPNDKSFTPALGYSRLTAFYDPLIRWTLPEREFKTRLLAQAGIKDDHHVVDLGCGTGTLALMIKKAHPDAVVWGVDADEKVLALARDKSRRAQIPLALHHGNASRLPFPAASVDRVVSSLFFHHLPRGAKLETLREARRVLRPGGEIHIADWGRPQNFLMRLAFLLVQALDGFTTTDDNVKGLLPELLREAGFSDAREGVRRMTVFGTLQLYQARV